MELGMADAVEMADLVARDEVSVVELVEACLRRIEAVDPQLGAFVHVDADGALARAGAGQGPLAGVPVAVKDLAAFPGLRWAMGSRLFAGNVAAEHSAYTAAFRVQAEQRPHLVHPAVRRGLQCVARRPLREPQRAR